MLYSARVRRISSHHHLMARGFVLSSETKTSSHFIRTSISRVSSPIQLRTSPFSANHLPLNPSIASINRLLCSCSSRQHDPIDMSKYIEAFAKRMAMAGLKPHHRIALGVSGGPDSMALCVLAASWKTNGTNATGGQSSSFIDGLLAIIVDHGLRSESKDEANTVSHRVLDMGVRLPVVNGQMVGQRRVTCKKQLVTGAIFNSDLQAVILTCRRTRLYVDQSCCNLINQSVTIMNKGYAVIDIEILNPSKVEDIFLSKFVALVLQFISQRHRPVRGSALKLLLDYFRTFPCKTSFTAAGCYICPAPGSKGSKILVCCSVDSCLPLKTELFHKLSCEGQKHFMLREIEQIIADGKPYLDHLVPDASNVLFLDGTSSESVLVEARRINILSESTYRNILSLRRDETKKFRSKTEDVSNCELMHKVETLGSNLSSPTLQPGYIGYFMNRFLVKWELIEKISRDGYRCESCLVGHDKVAEVRHMVDADWLYLAKLSECHHMENSEVQRVLSVEKLEQVTGKINVCSDYAQISAQNALRLLKSIPVAARRGLPVLVNPQGQLLSIPSVGFKYCPCLAVSAVFMPRVPLGGGHSSFI
ncbi:uncharacterized protein LOC114318217 isoform X3 [Camellia sinensis]|uniref:uncharacterized protein LOC114288821 isoform X3 n=1 Tax=Camellia sinensis TaxID=4442 RepID=UPI001036A8F1|nr:uncharacterized protein LOC114288821 isoform X3 [Camellia sinensis]XP_028120888.1 uncharacterized protein LOC114318217 isoform X3 [Camellia sinensis]